MKKQLTLFAVVLFVFALVAPVAAQDDDMMMADAAAVVLASSDADGAPEDNWLDAQGFSVAMPNEDGELMVDVYATGLVPEGVYTLWGVSEGLVGMEVAPAGGTPANEFTATEDGTAVVNVTVPAEAEYDMLVVAYHSDGQTYGDNPGAMGDVTFTHLMSAFPGTTEPAEGVNMLGAVNPDGTPEDIEEEAWLEATSIAEIMETEEGIEVTVHAANLVPEGLYTLWAVNMGTFGMDVAPAGGVEANEFTADENGFGTLTVTIAEEDISDALALAYHSDGQTYGDNPGPMGEVTFTHTMGEFPVTE